jgi:hypothetical protein
MRRIIIAILALVLTATWFAAWTFFHFARLGGWQWITLAMLFTGGFVPTTILCQRILNPLLGALNVIFGISFGFLSFFLLAALASWVTAAASRLSGFPLNARDTVFGWYGAAALLGLCSLFIASWLRVTRVTVRLRNLPRIGMVAPWPL